MDFGFLLVGLRQVSFQLAEGPSKTLSRFRVAQILRKGRGFFLVSLRSA